MPRKKKIQAVSAPQNESEIKCICQKQNRGRVDNRFVQCELCGNYQHLNCIHQLEEMEALQRYICPGCQFDNCDPFIRVLSNVIKPSLMKYIYQAKQSFTFTFPFNLDEMKSKCTEHPGKHFIVFRCLRLDNTGFCFEWPLNTVIKLNKKQVHKINSVVNVEHFEKKAVVLSWHPKIEEYIKGLSRQYYPYDNNVLQIKDCLNDKKDNVIEVYIKKRMDDDGFNYVLSGELIEVMDERKALERVKVISDKKMLTDYMTEVTEKGTNLNVINILKEEVSLIDVYIGEQRIKIPGRGFNCQHLGVFDLNSFINLNKSNRRYRCPICGKNSRLMYIDGVIKDIMEMNKEQIKLIIGSDYTIYSLEKEELKSSSLSLSDYSRKGDEDDYILHNNDHDLDHDKMDQEIDVIDIINDEEEEENDANNNNNDTRIEKMIIDDGDQKNDEEKLESNVACNHNIKIIIPEKEIGNISNNNNTVIPNENLNKKVKKEKDIKFPSVFLNYDEHLLLLKDAPLSKQFRNIINFNQFIYNDHLKDILDVIPN